MSCLPLFTFLPLQELQQMLGTFPKAFSQMAISQVAFSQVAIFLNVQLPKRQFLQPLPQCLASWPILDTALGPACSLQCPRRLNLIFYICRLGNCTFGNLPLGKFSFRKSLEKIHLGKYLSPFRNLQLKKSQSYILLQ